MRKAGRRVEWVAGRRSQRCRGRCHCHYRGRGRGHEAAAVVMVMVMVMEMESTARRGAAQGGYEATRWDGRRQIRAPRRLESSSIGRTAATEGSVREGVWACGRRRGLLRRREGEVRGDDGQHPVHQTGWPAIGPTSTAAAVRARIRTSRTTIEACCTRVKRISAC